MISNGIQASSCSTRSALIALDNSIHSENRKCRLDRKREHPCEVVSWSSCNWRQSFLVTVIVVLLNIASIECLQPRQEGMFTFFLFNLRMQFQNLHIFDILLDYDEVGLFICLHPLVIHDSLSLCTKS